MTIHIYAPKTMKGNAKGKQISKFVLFRISLFHFRRIKEYVFVNLDGDIMGAPEYFICTSEEAKRNILK